MDVILHLGAHRTGSTSFQQYMRANSDALAARGIGFWGPHRTRTGLLRGAIPGPGDPPCGRAQARARGRIALALGRSDAAGLAQLVISDENMIGTIRTSLQARRLYPDIGQRMARYGAAFGGRAGRAVLLIRSPDVWFSSAIGYAVARGAPVPGPQMLAALAQARRGWRDVITDLACALPRTRLIVLPFERVAGRADRQLEALCGLPGLAPAAHADIWVNRTPDLARLRALLAERGDRAPLPAGTGRWQPFDAAQRAALRESYADDLQWLRAGADGLAQLCDETAAAAATTLRGDGAKRHPPPPALTRGHDHEYRQRGLVAPR